MTIKIGYAQSRSGLSAVSMKEKLDGYDYFLERIKLSIKNVVIRDWYKCVWISDMQSLVLSREVYAEIYMAENELRAFISKVMIKHFGIDWNDRPEFYKLNTSIKENSANIRRNVLREDWPKNFEGTLFEAKAINYRKELLLKDLKRLVRCLEIYLSDYIFNLEVSRLLPEIESLPIINKVLLFNYTGTYENNYNKNPYLEVDYIHGRADLGNTIDTNNMVLGIDEYLKGEARNEEIEFIEFKKFFQRIHKETGCLYKSWLAKMKEQKEIKEITG